MFQVEVNDVVGLRIEEDLLETDGAVVADLCRHVGAAHESRAQDTNFATWGEVRAAAGLHERGDQVWLTNGAEKVRPVGPSDNLPPRDRIVALPRHDKSV